MKPLPKLAATMLLCAGLPVGSACAAGIETTPPPAFKKVSALVKLPDFLPGLGTLYVDPATLPVGPFLGYDRGGKLVNVTYMVPLKQMEDHKAMNDLGTAAKGVKIDHTDMYYNAGHPGVEEPHYHIVEWLIGKDEQTKSMK